MKGGTGEYGRTRTYLVARDKSGKVIGCMAYATPDPNMISHFRLEGQDCSAELLNAFISKEKSNFLFTVDHDIKKAGVSTTKLPIKNMVSFLT